MIKKNIKKALPEDIEPQRSGGWLFKGLILGGMVVFFAISYSVFKDSYRQNQINLEIAALQDEVKRLNQDNDDLTELISYLQTNDFREKEAKDKLNLIKEGESLMLVKEKEVAMQEPAAQEDPAPEVIVSRSNYYWWWHYYFSL